MSETNLLNVIKKIVLDVMESSKPVNVVFGTVVKSSPLQISIDQKLILSEKQLILTKNVTDYTINMSVDHITELNIGDIEEHNHQYKGKKEFIVHNSLMIGEKVLMIRMQEGQKYIVIDKVVKV